jgi:hypothetical protein
MKMLVCGGRDFHDRAALAGWMNEVIGDTPREAVVVIHGAARGADSLAETIAHAAGVTSVAYPAKWDTYGKAAGSIRNQQMLDHARPDVVLAAPGGRGTADMVRRALAAGVRVVDKRMANVL